MSHFINYYHVSQWVVYGNIEKYQAYSLEGNHPADSFPFPSRLGASNREQICSEEQLPDAFPTQRPSRWFANSIRQVDFFPVRRLLGMTQMESHRETARKTSWRIGNGLGLSGALSGSGFPANAPYEPPNCKILIYRASVGKEHILQNLNELFH